MFYSSSYFYYPETNMSRLYTLTLLLTFLITINGCGGGGTSPASKEYLSGIEVNCVHVDSTDEDYIVGIKAGTKGLIDMDCSAEDDPFSLQNSTPNLNITQVTRKVTIEAQCDGGNTASMSGTLNYSSGIFGITGTSSSGAPINCTIKYNPAALPATISSNQSITQLIAEYGDDVNNSISNTCPNNMLVTENYENTCNNISGDIDIHYVLTDDSNQKHEIIFNVNIKEI